VNDLVKEQIKGLAGFSGVIWLTIHRDNAHRPKVRKVARLSRRWRCAMTLLEQESTTSVAIKNVLFATDFSEASEAALPYVAAFSSCFGSHIHLTHVLPEVTFLRPGSPDPGVIGSIYEDAHSGAQEKMRRLVRRIKDHPHDTYLRHGEIPQVVSDLVREQEIDLIIVGTYGRTGLGRLIMGSVAEEILRQAPCPVLTVGPKVIGAAVRNMAHRDRELAPLPVQIRNILFATDFNQQSSKAITLALSLAREFHARLSLLHVIDDYGDHINENPGPIEISLRMLQELIPTETGQHPPEVLAQFGVPAEAILQTAAERETDLIVLGARPANGHLKAATHLSIGVAHRTVVGANCPVLTVRA
jgi:nucleotide-binding universal stress UspA family protein